MNPLTRTLLVAVAVVAAAAAPASAATDFDYEGGCSYEAVTNPIGSDPETFRGVLYGYAVVYSPSAPAEPVSATVTCTLSFEDGWSFTTSSSGTGFVYTSTPIAFTADHPFDQAEFCQTVDFHDDGQPPRTRCYEFTLEKVPPQEVEDFVYGNAPGLHDALCVATRTVEPFVPDVWLTLVINDDGDVFVTKHRFLDCP